MALKWVQLHARLDIHLSEDFRSSVGDNNSNDNNRDSQTFATEIGSLNALKKRRREEDAEDLIKREIKSGLVSSVSSFKNGRNDDDDDVAVIGETSKSSSKNGYENNMMRNSNEHDEDEDNNNEDDDDAVDVSKITNDSDQKKKESTTTTTWATEVLEAVRLINTGQTEFKDAKLRFEAFTKAGNKLTKISMSDVFNSLKRQQKGKRFDVELAREKLDELLKSRGDRGIAKDAEVDVVLRHLAHEMHAAIVSARISTRPPPAAQYKPDAEVSASFGKLEEFALTASERRNKAEFQIQSTVENLKNQASSSSSIVSNLDVNDDENLDNVDLTEGLSPQAISSAIVLDKAEVAMISERRSEQLFAAGIIGEWSNWGACVRVPSENVCKRTRTFAHSRNFGRCFKLEKNEDLMSREKMIQSLGFSDLKEVNNCAVKPQTILCDCAEAPNNNSLMQNSKDALFIMNKAALDADADVNIHRNKKIETKCLIAQDSDSYGYAERFIAAHKAHDDAKTAKSASSPMRLRWPVPNATQRKLDPQLVNLEITKDTFECVGNVGAGERKRAYVTTVAPGPNGNDAVWRFFFHPMLVKLLPQSETISKKRTYKTCAVVANSGLMLKNEFGNEIDEHEGIFRINYPPVKKFSKNVGSRTTHDIVNMHHAQRLGFNDARTLRINDPDVCDAKVCLGTLIKCRMKGCHSENLTYKQEDDMDLSDPNWRRREQLKKMKNPENSRLVLYETTLSMAWRRKFIQLLLRRFKPPMTSLLSPDFIVRANALWNSVSKDALLEAKNRGEQTPNCALTAQRAKDAKENWRKRRGAISISNAMNQEESCKPNSGWFAIVAAAQQCDKVTLYGFSAWKAVTSSPAKKSTDKSLDKDDIKYHYFDDVPGVDTVHSFELTLEALRMLQNAYPDVIDIREERDRVL